MRPVLDVDLGGIALRSPVMAASGCLRSIRDIHGLVDVRRLGAIASVSVTASAVAGSAGPRVAETPSGLLHATGHQNPGVDVFLEQELPVLARTGVPLFASVGGASLEEYLRVGTALAEAPGVVALEVNLACPSAERGGALFAHRPDHAAEIVGAVARSVRAPVFAKLSGDVADIVDVAGACVQAGAHGLTLIGAMPGMGVAPEARSPRLGSVTGWVSGPAIRPMAVRAVFLVSRAFPDLPIIGVGGVADASSAVEFLLAGAWAVQVGTAMLVDPDAPLEITKGILAYLRRHRIADPTQVRVSLRPARPVVEGGPS